MARLKEEDRNDHRIKGGYKLYDFKEETMEQAPNVNGVYVLFDELLEIVYIGSAKVGEMQDRLREKLKNGAYSKAKLRQVFETRTLEDARQIEKEWVKKYKGFDI